MDPTTSSSLPLTIRLATLDDIPALTPLINTSVRTLHAPFYSQAQIEGSLASVYGTDTTIVQDGNYFVVTIPSQEQSNAAVPVHPNEERIIACGGWSYRSTLYGGDQFSSRDDDNLMNPQTDAAKIRAFFVHPDFTRRGIGRMVLERCEQEARKRGFRRAEIGATLAGVEFYSMRFCLNRGWRGLRTGNWGMGRC